MGRHAAAARHRAGCGTIASMDQEDVGFLPAVSLATLFLFYIVWAALHDIAHEGKGYTLEYAALAISIPAFVILYRQALRVLTRRARLAWLAATSLLLALYSLGALNAAFHPKYPLDPTLGSAFLAAGLPALALLACRLVREWRGAA